MKNFEIAGYFKYANIRDIVSANSQKEALTQVLTIQLYNTYLLL